MRSYVCIVCGLSSIHDRTTGRVPERCPACRAARKRATDSAKSKRWREANSDYQAAYMRRYHQAHKNDPEYRRMRREAFLVYKYGITQAHLEELLDKQHHRCAICAGQRNGPGTRLHIDHCHESGRIRGLLCTKCNTALGLLDDDAGRAEAVAQYLRR